MICSACQFENPDGTKFCGGCGAQLTVHRTCGACGTENPGTFKFCGECGVPMEPVRSRPSDHLDTAERRHLTVLFTDLVDSTQLAGRLDPEEFRDVIRRYQSACHRVVERFEGHIAQLLGDGLLVYFGYPEAHEDDARRAVHTGLGIVEATGPLNLDLNREYGVDVASRVGIHAGEVVTGEMGTGPTRELLAMGQAPNVAARVQGAAKPNSVVVTDTVDRLVRGYFDCEALGKRTLKGVSKPINLFRVIRDSGIRDSFEMAVRRGLTPIAGRQTELEQILARAQEVQNGSGQIVCLSGAGGIGKSRLVNSLQQRAGDQFGQWLEGRCSPYHAQTAFAPFLEMLDNYFVLNECASNSDKISRIDERLAGLDLPVEDLLPLIAELLSIPADGSYVPSDADPRKKRERTIEALLSIVRSLAMRAPSAVVIEDLHWVDPSTLEVLSLIIKSDPPIPALTVVTFRPTFDPAWPTPKHLLHLSLVGLEPDHVLSMVGALAGGMALPATVLDQILEKTDGVPLFVEELTKTILESKVLRAGSAGYEIDGSVPAFTIPATLQDSLRARLDRLGDAKVLAQIASVIGRGFSYDMLQAVSEFEHADLGRYLGCLVHAGVVLQDGTPPDASYSFNHALVEDAAYASLVRGSRQEYHRRAATVLVDRFPEQSAARPEVVAQHFANAGHAESAVTHWLQAGQRAIRQFANHEAIEHLHRASELLSSLDVTAERYGKEIAIQTAMGSALVASRGYAADDVRAAFARAYELSEPMGDPPELFQALQGLWMFYVVRAEYGQALKLAGRLERAAASQSPALQMQGLYASAFTHFYLGDFEEARERFERAVALDDGTTNFQAVSPTGDDIRVHVLSFLALTLWHLGQPDTALAAGQRALVIARTSNHPYGISWALMVTGWLYQFRGETDRMQAHAREAFAIAADKGFSYILGMAGFLSSLALALDPDAEPDLIEGGIEGMRRSLQGLTAVGARLGETLMACQLIETCLRLGRFEDAATLLETYEGRTSDREERSWSAEFRRLAGELEFRRALDKDAATGHSLALAEAAFQEAIAISERQGALGLRLRAVHGLAQVMTRTVGKRDAVAILTKTLEAFAEGSETADIARARTLLRTVK